MCLGQQQPKAPEVRYVGPSDSDIRRNEESLAAFQSQIQQQQADTAAQIQKQIDAANARTAEIQSEYDSELAIAQGESGASEAAAAKAKAAADAAADEALKAKQDAAAAAGASYTPIGAYGVTASVSDVPTAQTTEKIKPKKKPKGSLKISPTSVATAGSGLNIGV